METLQWKKKRRKRLAAAVFVASGYGLGTQKKRKGGVTVSDFYSGDRFFFASGHAPGFWTLLWFSLTENG